MIGSCDVERHLEHLVLELVLEHLEHLGVFSCPSCLFDAIIDDGSHTNGAIMKSFELLWPSVKPGGRYFVEDMCVGRRSPWADGNPVPIDIFTYWMNQASLASPPTVAPTEHRTPPYICCPLGVSVVPPSCAAHHD